MISIDAYAYKSRISKIHPALKLTFFMVNLLAVSFSNGAMLVWLSFFSALLLTLGYSDLKLIRLMKWYSVPLGFIMIGLVPIAADVTLGNASVAGGGMVVLLDMHVLKLVTSGGQLEQAMRLLTKSMASIAWMFFLITTTPLNDILFALRRLHTPQIICDLMQLMYRFIFVLLDSASTIHFSQRSRFGYRTPRLGMRSFAFMSRNVLNQAFRHMETLRLSLVSRGFKKHLVVVDRAYTWPLNFGILSVCITAMTIACTLIGG